MVFVFLTSSPSMIISRSIHVATNGMISFFFMGEFGIYLSTYIYIYLSKHTHTHTPHPFYPFICQWIYIFFLVLAIMNSASWNIRVHVLSELLVLSRYMPRNGTAGSYGNSIFSLLRNCHTVLQNQLMFPPTMLFVDFLITTVLTGVRWYLFVVLICISLITNVIEHLMCLLTVNMSSLEKCLLGSSPHFLIGLFVVVLLSL